ncbi:sterile alpha motif domain-containing protein 14 isoform X2 [Columba livia]|uniref:sterile alpha motif domain-containing protein 14 isoform X2 n=1 Tax=Columba livia TaxID=8932 RepID=UPI0031B9B062
MSVSKLQDTDEVFETPRLDSSLQKARARLLAKSRRQRPSRSRLRDSASSTEGDEGPEAAGAEGDGGPPAPSPFSRGAEFSFEVGGARRALGEPPGPSPPLSRYRPLTDAWCHEGLAGPPSPKSCPSSDSSPGFAQPQRHSEDDSRDTSPPEPASPTVGLDKRTRRKFLDLGVTLRRASSSKSRREKSSNRLSMGSREVAEGPGRPSGSPFLPFSWFSDGVRGSGSPGSTSPAGSPRHEGLSPHKSASQDSTLSEDSPPPSASPRLPGPPGSRCSYPYHTLSQSSDELPEEPPGAAAGWTCRQVGQWLEGLGLGHHGERFSAHGVDGTRLLRLDGAKLKRAGAGAAEAAAEGAERGGAARAQGPGEGGEAAGEAEEAGAAAELRGKGALRPLPARSRRDAPRDPVLAQDVAPRPRLPGWDGHGAACAPRAAAPSPLHPRTPWAQSGPPRAPFLDASGTLDPPTLFHHPHLKGHCHPLPSTVRHRPRTVHGPTPQTHPPRWGVGSERCPPSPECSDPGDTPGNKRVSRASANQCDQCEPGWEGLGDMWGGGSSVPGGGATGSGRQSVAPTPGPSSPSLSHLCPQVPHWCDTAATSPGRVTPGWVN